MRPLSLRLSNVRIQLWAAIHKKKATRLGIKDWELVASFSLLQFVQPRIPRGDRRDTLIMPPSESHKTSKMQASLAAKHTKSWGYRSFKVLSPIHQSCQKRIRVPSPTTKDRCLEKLSHPFWMLLQIPHPWVLLHTFVYQPPWPSPYLAEMTLCQRWATSWPNRHNHFPNKAWLNDASNPQTPQFNR